MAARVISTRREDTPSGLRVEARTWAHDDLSFSGHVVVTGPAPHPGAADRRGILVERPVTLHCDYRGEPAQMMEEAIAEAIADAEQRAARVAP